MRKFKVRLIGKEWPHHGVCDAEGISGRNVISIRLFHDVNYWNQFALITGWEVEEVQMFKDYYETIQNRR